MALVAKHVFLVSVNISLSSIFFSGVINTMSFLLYIFGDCNKIPSPPKQNRPWYAAER